MRYDHTQRSPFFLLLALIASFQFVAAWFVPERTFQIILATSGGCMAILALAFRELTVRDEGHELLIAFGPLPLFRRRIQYIEIESAERSRSTLLDGWGIHMSLRGGWTWNIWGFDCVDINLTRGRKLRVGTDDPSGLASFLQNRSRGLLPQ